MRAVVLNGAREGEGRLDQIADLLRAELESGGWAADVLTLRAITVAPCAGCFACWVKTPGECVMPDGNRAITAATIASDLSILLTPVVFGGYSSELKKVIDHQIVLVSPFFMRIDGEVHHQPRYAHYPSLLAIGVQRAHDEAAARLFARHVACHGRNLHAPRTHSMIWQADTPDAALAQQARQALKIFEEVPT